ncbi:hypothetical protein AB4876_09455 [Zhongshania guokunii]|uniref:Uncharacterized protein n=1 Tax=Zhongshania guokunii TaxID=641783 RepID=A0ABV3U5J5_9GAMM
MFKFVNWADALFAMDRAWWRMHVKDVAGCFAGERYTSSKNVKGAATIDLGGAGNSGAAAIKLAAHLGAERIVLVGYDCQKSNSGVVHFHGDHPKGLGNAGSMPRWLGQYKASVEYLAGVEVINASRDTALNLWPRIPLEQALCDA